MATHASTASNGARANAPVTPALVSRLPKVGTTIFSVMSALAAEKNAVNLGQGFPDFNCDPKLVDAVTTAMQAGHNQYPPMPGVPVLRQAVARKIEALHGRAYHPDAEITITAGATQAITQFFFSTEAYFRFLDKVLAAGISAPILPGIMPVTSFAAIRRMSANTEIPVWMEAMFEGLDNRPGPRALVAATVAAEFCKRLYEGGVRDFHFYTLNRAEQAYAICHLLGLRPQSEPAA